MKTKPITRALALILLLATLLSAASILTSCSSSYLGVGRLLPKDELLANVNGEEDATLTSVTEYLDKWSFPKFSGSKLAALERLYDKNYVEDIEPPLDRAKKTAVFFLENYYDTANPDETEKTTDALISSYVDTMGDRYSIYRTAEEYKSYSTDMTGSFVGIGVSVLRKENADKLEILSVTEGGGAEEAGIKAGDAITKVDGVPVSELGFDGAAEAIRGEAGTTVEVTVQSGCEIYTITVTRRKIVEKSVTHEMRGNIAYIKITGFKSNTFEQFKTAIDASLEAGATGIIYDLRANPGGYLSAVVDMLDYIAPKGTVIVSFKNDYNGTMKANDSHEIKLPTVVICDGATASAGELFTAGVRDFSEMGFFEAKILGEKSFGKGIMQDTYKFTDGSSITMTVDYYNPPLGENYHGVGITPDLVPAEPDKDGSWIAEAEELLKTLIK